MKCLPFTIQTYLRILNITTRQNFENVYNFRKADKAKSVSSSRFKHCTPAAISDGFVPNTKSAISIQPYKPYRLQGMSHVATCNCGKIFPKMSLRFRCFTYCTLGAKL